MDRIEFRINDSVRIDLLSAVGRVSGILHESHGVRYQVRYAAHGEMREAFFPARELETWDEDRLAA